MFSNPRYISRTTKEHLHYAPSHKDVYQIVGTGVLDGPRHIIFGRDFVFSADLCYNGTNKKAFLREEGGTRSVTEGACVTLNSE